MGSFKRSLKGFCEVPARVLQGLRNFWGLWFLADEGVGTDRL